MKLLSVLFVATAFAPVLTASTLAEGKASPRPNILVILADDLGWIDTGYNGSDFHETPHIDRLAKQGTVFSNAYAGGGNCAPSRACLWSGQYTPRHGIYAVGRTTRGPAELQRGKAVPNTGKLASEKITLAESLRAAGYRTGLFGKWHLGKEAPYLPTDQGFDVYFDSYHGKESGQSDPEDPKGAYSLTRAALKFIEERDDRPFFACLCHHAIHSALEARTATLKKFKEQKPGTQHHDALYAACLYDLDDTVGLLMNRLEELGLADNTLLVFTSDNGGTGRASQEPLRGGKGAYYEAGIRVPFIVRWPAGFPSRAVNAMPVINLDLYPTLLAAAGARPPANYPLDGENLMPLFSGQAETRKQPAIFWHFPGYLDGPVARGRDPVFRTRPVTVIRQGDWKLHLYHEEWVFDGGRERIATNRSVELYHIADDPGERIDLANKQTAKRDELLETTLAWIDRTGARLVTRPNPGYDMNATPHMNKGRKNKSDDED